MFVLRAAKESELRSVLKLVNLALQRLPAAFSSGDCATALSMLLQLLPLFADKSVECAFSDSRLQTLLDPAASLPLQLQLNRLVVAGLCTRRF